MRGPFYNLYNPWLYNPYNQGLYEYFLIFNFLSTYHPQGCRVLVWGHAVPCFGTTRFHNLYNPYNLYNPAQSDLGAFIFITPPFLHHRGSAHGGGRYPICTKRGDTLF
jgi:hypothetical protein